MAYCNKCYKEVKVLQNNICTECGCIIKMKQKPIEILGTILLITSFVVPFVLILFVLIIFMLSAIASSETGVRIGFIGLILICILFCIGFTLSFILKRSKDDLVRNTAIVFNVIYLVEIAISILGTIGSLIMEVLVYG